MSFTSFRSVIFVIAVALTATAASAGPVSVLQVEADYYGSIANEQYAPVNFAGADTVVSSGMTFHALSTVGTSGSDPSNSTYSPHAYVVYNRIATADGPSNPVTDIWCLSADDFLTKYVKVASSSSTTATRPASVGNSIKVVNHSWVGGYETTAMNADAVRRMDYMIRREDLVMVNAAVSPWGGSATPVPWANRNGIAVCGTWTLTPTDATGIGKRHADLWGPKNGTADEVTSYNTPGVAGYAAALVNEADNRGWSNGTNGLRHEVVKSVLMTGADKTAFTTTTGGFTSWTSNGVNNLDNVNGAGRADYAASLAVLAAGQKTMTTATGTTVSNPLVTKASAGWWYESALSGNNSQALILDLTWAKLTDLTATLAWDVTQTEGTNNRLNTTASGTIFADLDLELIPVTQSGTTFTFGSSMGIAGLMSKSTDDNVEHLYFKDTLNPDFTLDHGYYALVVSNKSGFSWNYGLSYEANLDFSTDATDLNRVLSYYNQPGDWTKGDYNGDGFVDATDLNTVLSYYNQTANQSAVSLSVVSSTVPEPGALLMTVAALVLGLIYFGTREHARVRSRLSA